MRKKKNFLYKDSIPFLLLMVIHVGLFLVLLKQRRHREAWVLFLSNVGFAYLFEYPTLNLFHGYRYKTSMMKKSAFDNILGAILSQGMYVPITATYLTLLQKNWKWKVSFSAFYYFIEKLFRLLNIYKVYWWKSIYTPVLTYISFYLSDGFYKSLISGKRWAMALAHYLAVEVISVTLMYIFATKRRIRFGRGHFHTLTEHFKIVPLYSLALSFIATVTSSRLRFHYQSLMLFSHILIDKVLKEMGILKMDLKSRLSAIFWYSHIIFTSRFFYKTIYKKTK